MVFIVNNNCNECRYTNCVSVCPVDCFYGDEKQLYINPDECIDCGACESECPVSAIIDENDLLDGEKKWIFINAEKSVLCQNVTEKQNPLETAERKKLELGF